MTLQSPILCLVCESEAQILRGPRLTAIGSRSVVVEDEWMYCAACDEEFYSPRQADQLHIRAVHQIRLEDGLLPPESIKDIRKRLGLTQRDFERLIGTGEKTCVRWESGRVCQSVAADRLIRLLAANRENVLVLAALSGIAIREPDFLDAYGIDNLGYSRPSNVMAPPFPLKSASRVSIEGTTEMRELTHTAEFAAIQSVGIPSRKHRVTEMARVC